MSPSEAASYTEDQLVEQPAIELLQTLGWDYYYAYDEFGQSGSPLGRESKGEVVLTARLLPALEGLNPGAPSEAIAEAVDELTRDRSRMNPVVANREVYHLLKNGIRATVQDADGDDVVTLRQHRMLLSRFSTELVYEREDVSVILSQ